MLGIGGAVMDENDTGLEAADTALLSADDFRGWIGRSIAFAGTEVVLVLHGIQERSATLPSGRRPFVLVFSGEPVLPPDPGFLDEGTYDCGPEGEPARTIHVSPVRSRSPERQDYQAVFA